MSSKGWMVHESFFELYDQMLSASTIPEVLDRVSRAVCDTMAAEATSVFLLREDTGELEANARIDSLVRTIRIPIENTSLSGYCALEQKAFLVHDAYGDLSTVAAGLRFDRSWDEAHGFRTRDVMCAPALFRGEVVGVVQVINSLEQGFSIDDLAELESVARLVGYVLHQIRLYDDLATMKELQKQKAKFMLVMIHELKAPVAAAKMLGELVDDEDLPTDKRLDLAGRIVERLDGLTEIIQDTLDLAGVAEGKPLSAVEPIDLFAAVGEVFEKYQEGAHAKGLRYELDLPPRGEEIVTRIDGRGLQLILSNLVSNAVKYTPEGRVDLTLRRDERYASVRVCDTGMGIPEEDLPQLFTEYFRASNARSSRVEGTGVGLAAVKEMIERFNGRLHLETSVDQGSTFEVRLPLFDG